MVSNKFMKGLEKNIYILNFLPQFSDYAEDFKETTIHLILFENEKVISGLTLIEKKFIKITFHCR